MADKTATNEPSRFEMALDRQLNCPHDHLEDFGDGMCYLGCCDRKQCQDCGMVLLIKGGMVLLIEDAD